MSSEPATARIVTVPRDGGRCFNRYVGSDADEQLTGSPFGDACSAPVARTRSRPGRR